jgi:hypothetical protein
MSAAPTKPINHLAMEMNAVNSKFRFVAAALVPFAFAACDTTEPDGFDTSELVAELAIEPHHFHIWETNGTFTVTVLDPDEEVVTEFEDIRVQHMIEGGTSWRTISLVQDGDFFYGAHVFDTSGNYALRVVAMREGDTELVPIYVAPELLEVVRAHSHAGGYTVEFETFPGHIHDGDAGAMTFWFEDDAGAPVAGLSPTVLIGAAGAVATYAAVESLTTPGRYSADHTFGAAGDISVGIEYTGTAGTGSMTHTYMIPIHIAEAH